MPTETLLDKILAIVKDLPESQQKRVYAFAAYLKWRLTGGPVTAEIEEGQKIYHEFTIQNNMTAILYSELPTHRAR